MKRTQISPGAKSLERGSTFASRGSGLKRTAASKGKRTAISPASPEQRAKVAHRACVACAGACGSCHPAHLVDRSLGGCDSVWCVVPLCPAHHREYDEGSLDLLPHLEPHWRAELAHAVEHVGLLATVRRVTNEAPQTVQRPVYAEQ